LTAGVSSSPPAADPPTVPGLEPVRRRSHAKRPPGGAGGVLAAAAVGSAVSVGLGVYGRVHEPTFVAINVAGFSSGTAVKAWLGSAVFLLALVQLGTAIVMQKRFRSGAPTRLGVLHRWSGRAAVLLSVPVAVHCLYALGFQAGSPRVLVHSLAGCLFYGAFVTKMLVLPKQNTPGWSLPLLGGAVFTTLTAVWLSSALWFFTTSGLTF
jgi:Family of unknown function (DUF6529)